MSIEFSGYEDKINQLMDNISTSIENLTGLSIDKTENAIIEINNKITEGQSILKNMDEYIINNNENKNEENTEISKKVNNYKREFQSVTSKFQNIQNNYINSKEKKALIEDLDINIDKELKNNQKQNLIDENNQSNPAIDVNNNNVINNVQNNQNLNDVLHIKTESDKENFQKNNNKDEVLNVKQEKNQRCKKKLLLILLFLVVGTFLGLPLSYFLLYIL